MKDLIISLSFTDKLNKKNLVFKAKKIIKFNNAFIFANFVGFRPL